jgi:hypothetical protein
MKVIWKRPDGFHGADPSDYYVVQVAHNAKIWLHKTDSENFPFRISGGWQDEVSTVKLNKLVNLIGQDEAAWLSYLLHDYHNSEAASSESYLQELEDWLSVLGENLKGDNWALMIMQEVLQDLQATLTVLAAKFKQKAKEANSL